MSDWTPVERAEIVFLDALPMALAFCSGTDAPAGDPWEAMAGSDKIAASILAIVERAAQRRGVFVTRVEVNDGEARHYGSYQRTSRTITVTQRFSRAAQAGIALHEFVHAVDPEIAESVPDGSEFGAWLRARSVRSNVREIETHIATGMLCEDFGVDARLVVRQSVACHLAEIGEDDPDHGWDAVMPLDGEWPVFARAVDLYERAKRELVAA